MKGNKKKDTWVEEAVRPGGRGAERTRMERPKASKSLFRGREKKGGSNWPQSTNFRRCYTLPEEEGK